PTLLQAIKEEPDDGSSHYMLGDAYYSLDRPEDAEQEMILAMKDTTERQEALRGVARVMIDAKQLDKAAKYVDQYHIEYPGDGADFDKLRLELQQARGDGR